MKNKDTLQVYEQNIEKYYELTPTEMGNEFGEFWNDQLKDVPKSASILEIGTATGRTAEYIESLGYMVERSDVVDAFIQEHKRQGREIKKIDILQMNTQKKYDLIIAEAVVLHLNDQEFQQALVQVHSSLSEKGIFLFTCKDGEGEIISSHKMGAPRYFNFWTQQRMNQMVEEGGFETLSSGYFEKANKWLYFRTQKA